MAALHVPAVIRYDPLLILASVVVAVAVSIATLTFAERLQAERPGRAALERVVIAAVMAGGLWVMHELASRSGRFVALPGQQDELRAAAGHPHALAQAWVGPWITAAAIAGVLALAFAATVSRWHAHRHGNRPAGDRLTGLPNGTLLRQRLAEALTQEAPCAVIALRLENFDTLRQGLGRRAAERLIVRLGWRLAGAVRPVDFVGRLSSSQYAVLVDDIEAVGSVAERVRERLGAPMSSDGLLVLVPVAVGIAVARDGDSATDLLARAEQAAARESHRAPLAAVAAPSMAA
jgi:diguanylate cyclase